MTLKKNLLSIGMIIALIAPLGCNGIKETPHSSEENLRRAVLDSTQNQAEDTSFIFPQSSTRKLTSQELNGLGSEELALARNEIYARRGYVFAESKYADYFKQKAWYKPDSNPSTALNSIEVYNVSFIKFFEQRFAHFGSGQQLSNVYKLGQNVQLDINGDNIKEQLLVQKKFGKVIVSVNRSSLEIDSNNPSDYFAVVDIDKKDNYKEIVLGDYGPSDDYTSVFCYFNGKKIINMGKTESLFNLENTHDGTLTIDGSGKILAMTRSQILQTWYYSKEFVLSKNHYLEAVPLALYPTDYDVFVIQPFNLYLSKGDRTPILPINEGQKLKIIGTDDQAWCLLQTTTGTKGWIVVKNFNVLENNGLKAEETFAGLLNID